MFLNNPFPAASSFATTLRFSLLAGFVVFLILYLFRPFNIDAAANHFAAWHALLYALVTSLMILLNSLLMPVIFRTWFREENWTLGREILVMCWHVLSISFVNLLITHWLYGEPLSLQGVISFLLITAAVGIFPVSLILLLKQQFLYKRFERGATAIQQQLHSAEPVEGNKLLNNQFIHLTGDNLGEQLSIPAIDLRFITAADNYLRVAYVQDGKLCYAVLRATLKKAEAMVNEHPNLLRCHRAYIVNLGAVYRLSGNAQGFKLHLMDTQEPIPVSRSLNESLADYLKKYSRLSH